MNALLTWLKNNIHTAVGGMSFISFVTFVGHLVYAYESGTFNLDSIQQMLVSSSGLQAVILAIIYAVLKLKNVQPK